jgi:hypothetical protein
MRDYIYMDLIAETRDLIGALNSKRGALMERIAFNKNTRQALSLKAHLGNKKAAKTIADLHEESRRLSDEDRCPLFCSGYTAAAPQG